MNGSESIVLHDPWVNGTKAAPFDQSMSVYTVILKYTHRYRPTEFYLILDVGVGGTNGWFPDGKEKPWLDGSLSTYTSPGERQ